MIKFETPYGTMKFKTHIEGYEFRDKIVEKFSFIVAEDGVLPRIEEAVELHFAFLEGGMAEVRQIMRERHRKTKEQEYFKHEFGSMPRELWGMPPEVIRAEWDRRMAAGWLGW